MTEIIDKLNRFREKEKFADSEWDKRGLNPSDSDLCLKMETLLNNCTDSLIASVQQNKNGRISKRILKNGLQKFNKLDYDTEEKEFICDYFFELSQILNIDIKNDLNNWLYGFGLSSMIKVMSALKKSDKIIETLSQNCTKCDSKLETFIMERQSDIPDLAYDIVKCKTCGEYNMIDKGPGIKRLKFGNYDWVEQLLKEEYDSEQAKTRLEQIKFFRK
ncbi:DUF4844 domain-containing protein [Carboxylicivirga linearis]|uniref:DUF4844 domain-containing protein n=1 Tax=Carboxylicivirga linearis TaxID=1628157 RepID=A0ABS5K1W2_9BACT|nr:DUF4844 domain-containing protein [Carboxylicivirga linearis]MBS2101157.1 DUF4844 domain-containing protein [Carboxylicivirga linearis]